jgi:hypothetical protein
MELRAQFARLSGELRRGGGRIMGDTRPGMAWKIIANWKITMLLMGKSTISMARFNSFLYVYQGVSWNKALWIRLSMDDCLTHVHIFNYQNVT